MSTGQSMPLLRAVLMGAGLAGLATMVGPVYATHMSEGTDRSPRGASPAREQVAIGKDGVPAALVPAGEFEMGSLAGLPDEKPVHRLQLDAYYMDQYEVTTALYAKFLEATGQKEPDRWNEVSVARDAKRPVVGVDWQDADAYCRWAGKRLPTEAEWEKAARGRDKRSYPWGDQSPNGLLSSYNWTSRRFWEGYETLSPVGSYEAGKSAYGIYDLAGNVGEWVADWYDEQYYSHSPEANPAGPSIGDRKVVRGGAWLNEPMDMRSAKRYRYLPTFRNVNVGFRCVQDVSRSMP